MRGRQKSGDLTECIITAPSRWTLRHACSNDALSEEIGPVIPSRKFSHGTDALTANWTI